MTPEGIRFEDVERDLIMRQWSKMTTTHEIRQSWPDFSHVAVPAEKVGIKKPGATGKGWRD